MVKFKLHVAGAELSRALDSELVLRFYSSIILVEASFFCGHRSTDEQVWLSYTQSCAHIRRESCSQFASHRTKLNRFQFRQTANTSRLVLDFLFGPSKCSIRFALIIHETRRHALRMKIVLHQTSSVYLCLCLVARIDAPKKKHVASKNRIEICFSSATLTILQVLSAMPTQVNQSMAMLLLLRSSLSPFYLMYSRSCVDLFEYSTHASLLKIAQRTVQMGFSSPFAIQSHSHLSRYTIERCTCGCLPSSFFICQYSHIHLL